MPISYSALVDARTLALLTVSRHISGIVFLSEAITDAHHVIGVNFPNYMTSFPLASADPETYPEWTWDYKSRQFAKTKSDALTDDIRARSQLAVAKLIAISKIMYSLSQARYNVRTGIDFQETVYMTKKIQAATFKDSGYNEDHMMDFPYVLQYADFANISLQQAADDILFKAKLDDELLAKTELLRLKYFEQVRQATDPEKLPNIVQQFFRECFEVAIKA